MKISTFSKEIPLKLMIPFAIFFFPTFLFILFLKIVQKFQNFHQKHICTLLEPSNCSYYFQQGHKNTVTSVAISPKQPNLVFTAALDCCIIEWDLLTGKKIIISKGKKIKSSANKEKKEKKGKTKAKKPQKQKKPQKNEVILPKTDDHTDAILCLDVSNDGRFLASAGKDKVIKIWDIATKKFLFQFDHAHSSVITSVSFNKLKVGKTSSSSSTNDQDDDDEKVGGKNEFTVDFQKETNALASSSTDLTLKMWDVDDQMFYQTLHGHEGALLGVDCITRNIVVTSSLSFFSHIVYFCSHNEISTQIQALTPQSVFGKLRKKHN